MVGMGGSDGQMSTEKICELRKISDQLQKSALTQEKRSALEARKVILMARLRADGATDFIREDGRIKRG